MTGLARKPVLPSPVRQARSLKRTQAAVLMIHPTELAVRRPVVRRILRCLLRLTVQTVPTAASTPVIILVIQTVRLVLRLPTPEVAAGQPVTDVIPKLVIILINPAAHRAVPVIPDVLAALIPFLTVAAVPVQNVLPAVTHLLLTGVLIMEHAMVTVAKTVLGIHVMNVAVGQGAAARGEAPAVQGILGNTVVTLTVQQVVFGPASTGQTNAEYKIRERVVVTMLLLLVTGIIQSIALIQTGTTLVLP